ncbi:GntR family transcriptional regulator [Microbacterium phyllosphaerae]|uniref:GntR family transcriptional regulator n=1 Tax=Microbacterium phyllosphaerae TaxID=124798 RepID=UPI0021670804|nr:GntR family transcriptional regulator [Microbacterium phyllosphaerae]MCS3442176.1 DNA-binding transcriptional regulator YhcF (GntR family) [Microbacterium phyllosphaerae]
MTPKSADDIAEAFRAAILIGQIGDGERLPTVRRTASDFGVALATAAKAYKSLEQAGLVVSRTAAGTRVAPGAGRAPAEVIAQVRALVEACDATGVSAEDAVGILRASWPAPSGAAGMSAP